MAKEPVNTPLPDKHDYIIDARVWPIILNPPIVCNVHTQRREQGSCANIPFIARSDYTDDA